MSLLDENDGNNQVQQANYFLCTHIGVGELLDPENIFRPYPYWLWGPFNPIIAPSYSNPNPNVTSPA